MEVMVYECMLRWYKSKKNSMPLNVLYYRDGVGDSYYPIVRQEEVTAIRRAWEQLWKKVNVMAPPRGKPSITTVIVTKRHHTRLYPGNMEESKPATKSGNCQPGTVVDSGITHPYYFDFFLLSHNSPMGTARPAHYFVLENEMKLSATQLQDFTFSLCHTYGKSNNAVSYAPPAYYADRLCERGRLYLRPFHEKAGEYREQGLSAEEVMEKAKAVFYRGSQGGERNPWHPDHDGKMFWM